MALPGVGLPETGVHDRTRILVVEDEPEFADLVALWLERSGWEALVVGDGALAAGECHRLRPDLVLLDLGLPNVDGWELLETLRRSTDVPVVLVTARGAEADRVRGLRLGADDYITKPLSFPELVARVETALRRAQGGVFEPTHRPLRCGIVSLEVESHRVEVAGVEVHVTPTEFRLLQHLAEHCDRVVPHRELLETAWGPGYADETHLLQVAIGSLRGKIAVVSSQPVIATVYGLGYRMMSEG
jgi:DNA-binding response OmpR family regulator